MVKKKKYPHGCKTYSEYEKYVLEHPGSYHCKECGKHINSYLKNMEEYVWKITRNGGVDYFCSYTCMRKVEKRKEEIQEKKEKAKLLNKYKGILSLPECQFMEDYKICEKEENYMTFKVSINSYKDFRTFIARNYDNIKDMLGLD